MERMPRIYIIAPHRPSRSPSQRYRIEQYLPYFHSHGFTSVYSPLLDAWDDGVLYSHGRIAGKALILVKALLRRLRDLWRIQRGDIVLVHREAFMMRGVFFERAFRWKAGTLVFDFDDAIWKLDVSEGNKRLSWLKHPGKTDRIIALSDRVIAGNAYLAGHAKAINENTVIIPTVIDTERYRPMAKLQKGSIVIGWTGSRTSTVHLLAALPILQKLQQRFGARIQFRVISDIAPELPGLDVEHVRWNAESEVEDLVPMDIGIMPMPDDEWSRGKCGFKGLQYMGMGKAVVLSDVGVNSTIVQHGVNGMLARTETEWLEALGRLVEDDELRARSGVEARRTVEQHWSLLAWRDRALQQFQPLQ
jgi:glycosyltransferase involved in cell wall biosynthesis